MKRKCRAAAIGLFCLALLTGMSILPLSGSLSKTLLRVQAADAATPEVFRVVGYYSGDLFQEPVSKLQTDKLTHIIYAFLIPQADGSLLPMENEQQLRDVIRKAHADGAEVLIALGGWSHNGKPLVDVFETIAASDALRAKVVENVCTFVRTLGLDGVEVDWEHPRADTIEIYEKLIVEMKAALQREGKQMTAALNGAWSTTAGPEVSSLMTDACLASFDFINVMGYDMNNEEHSPLWFANTSIDYWLNRGVPAHKIVIGMPLYGRPSWMQYRHLVELNPEYAWQDYADTAPEPSWYNGLNTLREKTGVAMRKAGGVMLFDVNEDAEGEASVVSMIDELIGRAAAMTKQERDALVTVFLDNRELIFYKEEGMGLPFIDENNRTLIPMRKPLEAIGAEVKWDGDTRTVTAVRDGTTVTVTVGRREITVNGLPVMMDTQAVLQDERTYIPLRAVFEAFGYVPDWHGVSRSVCLSPAVAPAQ